MVKLKPIVSKQKLFIKFKIMRFLYILLTASFFFSCQRKPNLEFDTVDFYRIKYDAKQEEELLKNNNIASQNITGLMHDPHSIKNISAYYNVININSALNKKITSSLKNDIIEVHEASIISSTIFCIPFYRDVLIFKKENDTTGIAKICFDCGQNNFIVGNNNFDQLNVDYTKIKKILDSLAVK